MNNKFIVKVFFRGDWCPWSNAYLRDFDATVDKIRALGGDVLGITSQEGNKSKQNNNLSFDVLVDNKNIEAKKYDIFITAQQDVPNADAIDFYAYGMVQPGVVIEDSNGRILYRWAIDPNEMNLGGASDRPLVKDIVDELENILEGKSEIDTKSFRKTDLDDLRRRHPNEFKTVQAYIASLGK